jgi:hypothetical protein
MAAARAGMGLAMAWQRAGRRPPAHHQRKRIAMPKVTHPAAQKGDFLVDYEEKVFEDVKAEPG